MKEVNGFPYPLLYFDLEMSLKITRGDLGTLQLAT